MDMKTCVRHRVPVARERAPGLLVGVHGLLADRDRGGVVERGVESLDAVGAPQRPGERQPAQRAEPASRLMQVQTEALLELLDLLEDPALGGVDLSW